MLLYADAVVWYPHPTPYIECRLIHVLARVCVLCILASTKILSCMYVREYDVVHTKINDSEKESATTCDVIQ